MILDALRRADSERERGSVPGLHAQPVAPLSVDGARRAPAMRWHWVAIGALAGLVVVLAWLIVGREAQRPPAVGAAETAAGVAPAGPAAAVAPPPPAADDHRSLPIAEAAPWPQPEPRNPAAKAVDAAPASARPDAATAASTGAAAAETPIYAREQLPENIRATLPALTFGGSMYSSNPANRTLVVNGMLFREKDQITADLALDQIGPKAAVFRFKGYRFEVAY